MVAMITKGLANYAIIKAALTTIPIFLFLCVSLYYLKYNLGLNYQYSQGNIYTDVNKKLSNNIANSISDQQLNYTADILYDVLLPLQKNNIPYSNGNVSVYYPLKTPSIYSLNYNPVNVGGIMSCICCLLFISSIFWLYFLSTHKSFAAVDGGLEVSNSIFNMFNRD
jgi:hypothetical protein